MKVTIVGTGYVGLVTGVCLAHSGHDVTCLDVDRSKVSKLSAGECTIYEPGLEPLLQQGLSDGNLCFRSVNDGDLADSLGDVVFIAVGTPQSENGSADLRYVRDAVAGVSTAARKPITMVMKSTVPPGTGRMLSSRYLSGSEHPLDYVSNPEFLREGRAIEDWFKTDRIVLGGSPEAVAHVASLYADIEAPIIATDIESAETIKYASNAFLSTKISFINEMANVCDFVGADIDSVARGIGMDRRIGPDFLSAGIGYGGSCFPKDTRALDFISTLNGYRFDLLKAVIDVNNRQRLLPVIHLTRNLDLHGRKVAVLGLSFKPHTDDVRESPALDIVPLLCEQGANVVVYDPVAADVPAPGAERVDSVAEALAGAAAVLIVTDWPQFSEIDWTEMSTVMDPGAIVFDGRNQLNGADVTKAGLVYMAVGRPGAHRTAPV